MKILMISAAKYETQTEAEVAYEHAVKLPGTRRVYLNVRRVGTAARTLLVTAALLLAKPAYADPIPAGCGKDAAAAVQAHLHEARVLADASDADYKAASDCDDQIAALQELIAEERKNPAGVVDLRRLHELGADIQVQQAAKAAALAEAKGLTAKAAELLAEAKAAMARCKR